MDQPTKAIGTKPTSSDPAESLAESGGSTSILVESASEQEVSVWERIAHIRADVSARTEGRGLPDADELIDHGRV